MVGGSWNCVAVYLVLCYAKDSFCLYLLPS